MGRLLDLLHALQRASGPVLAILRCVQVGIPPPALCSRPSVDELREMTPQQRSWAAFLDRSDEWEEDFVWRMFFTHCDKMPKAIHEQAWKRRRRS